MSNTISSTLAAQIAAEAANAAPPVAHIGASTSASAAAAGESVTLSPDAQAAAQLLDAAQTSNGVDDKTVASLRAALADGSYQVSPEDLAQAIATVLKETL